MGTDTIPKNDESSVAESPSDFELQIIRQIEYYFGNYNLSRDKFLREQLKVDDGWVPLKTLIKFNRLKKLSEDFNVIIEALKKSPKQLMEVSEDCEKIRRRTAAPVPEDYRKRQAELDERTLYVKGFKKTNTLDELLDFFRGYNVEHIFMRKNMQHNSKPFKGSVFALFESKEDCDKFFEMKGLKYNGTELLKERKPDYVKRKDEFLKTIREEKAKRKLKKAGVEKEEKADKKIPEIKFVAGSLLKVVNLDENCTREQLKAAFNPLGTLVYVDYSKGNPDAVLRFDSGVANSILEKLESAEEDGKKKIKLETCTAIVSSIEGEDEKKYWENIAESRANLHKFSKGHKGFGNKGRFKKWGKRQKDKEDKDDESEEPPLKRKKADPSEENKEAEIKKENDKSSHTDVDITDESRDFKDDAVKTES